MERAKTMTVRRAITVLGAVVAAGAGSLFADAAMTASETSTRQSRQLQSDSLTRRTEMSGLDAEQVKRELRAIARAFANGELTKEAADERIRTLQSLAAASKLDIGVGYAFFGQTSDEATEAASEKQPDDTERP